MYKNLLLFVLLTVLFTFWHNSVLAAFIKYSDESSWQVAAGATILEDFESYSVGDTISNLPALGVGFTELSGGGYPNIYKHGEDVTPYGRNHLGNFPNGIGSTNRWNDLTMFALPGYEITAVGFWNGDGQADTLYASVYDFNGIHLGDFGAFKGTFAGFISDAPISLVIFDGNTGDGWNHLDGLQTNATTNVPVAEPSTILLFGTGLACLIGNRLRRKKK